jgi:hypothetical protein
MPRSSSVSLHSGSTRHMRGSLTTNRRPSANSLWITLASRRFASRAAFVASQSAGNGVGSNEWFGDAATACNRRSWIARTADDSQYPRQLSGPGATISREMSAPSRFIRRVTAEVPERCSPQTMTQGCDLRVSASTVGKSKKSDNAQPRNCPSLG